MSVNFALLLLILLLITGAISAYHRWIWRPARKRIFEQQMAEFDQGRALALRSAGGDAAVQEERRKLGDQISRQPWWIEYSVSFFPVILFVFVLRSFIVEPFRIPSGSMMPTLQVGDLILVNKFTYGLRLPVTNTLVLPLSKPERGDVMVFRYPVDTRLDYIKRVVAVPGDVVAFENKRLYLNGQAVPLEPSGQAFDAERMLYAQEFREQSGDHPYSIMFDPNRPTGVWPVSNFPHREACEVTRQGMRCTVPERHYFVMGDNRDNSLDSRFWGFVPEDLIVGQAFFVWMNFGDLGRIGRFD